MTLTFLFFLIQLIPQPQGIVTQQLLTSRDMDPNNFWDMRPSPDGRQLAYSAIGRGGSLFVRGLTTGESIQLTSNAEGVPGKYTYSPVWSPDGKRIAYGVQKGEVLKIVNVASRSSSVPEGTEGLQLTPLDWSPDGDHLVCNLNRPDRTSTLVLVSLPKGKVVPLVSQGWNNKLTAVFSRDGRYIAYSAIEDGNKDIFIIAADGSTNHRVTDNPGPDQYPLWSPGGDTLVYTAQDGIWAIAVVDGLPAGRPRFIRSQSFGRPLIWTAEAGLFYQQINDVRSFHSLPVDPETGKERGSLRPLLDVAVKKGNFCAWSPDMQAIAFSQYDGKIHVKSIKDRSTRSFSIGGRVSRMWWSADGKQVLFVPYGDGARGRRILALTPSDGTVRPLFASIKDAERFDLRPDGRQMLFYRWNGDRNNKRRELVVSGVGQRDGRVLASEQDEAVGRFSNWMRPLFSPDGSQVLFATMGGDLWLAASDGSKKRRIASVKLEGISRGWIHYAAWHPKGHHIVFDIGGYDNGKARSRRPGRPRRRGSSAVFVLNVKTGEQHRISLPEHVLEHVGVMQWSPDGKHIAFRGKTGGGPELWSVKNLLAAKPKGS